MSKHSTLLIVVIAVIINVIAISLVVKRPANDYIRVTA